MSTRTRPDPPGRSTESALRTIPLLRNGEQQVDQRGGVLEYVVWRVEDHPIDGFALRKRRFDPLSPGAAGVLRSEVFPELWLDPAALLRRDMATVLRVARQGLNSPGPAAFVDRPRQAAAKPAKGGEQP